MSIALQVGEPSDLPPVPDNFPRCGSWYPIGNKPEKGRKYGASAPSVEKPRKNSNPE